MQHEEVIDAVMSSRRLRADLGASRPAAINEAATREAAQRERNRRVSEGLRLAWARRKREQAGQN